jgi:hypothetical protein
MIPFHNKKYVYGIQMEFTDQLLANQHPISPFKLFRFSVTKEMEKGMTQTHPSPSSANKIWF